MYYIDKPHLHNMPDMKTFPKKKGLNGIYSEWDMINTTAALIANKKKNEWKVYKHKNTQHNYFKRVNPIIITQLPSYIMHIFEKNQVPTIIHLRV